MQLTPNPTADPGIASDNQSLFPWFLVFFLFIFASTGIGNGSTYKMIPAIWRREAETTTEAGTPERAAAITSSTKQASAALGVIGAIGAMGGFLIPIAFSSPWVDNPLSATKGAFVVFTAYYVVCALVTYAVYLRTPGEATQPCGCRGLMTDTTHCPYCSLQCGMTLERTGRAPGGPAVGGVPRQRGGAVPQGLDGHRAARPPRAADDAAGAGPRDR